MEVAVVQYIVRTCDGVVKCSSVMWQYGLLPFRDGKVKLSNAMALYSKDLYCYGMYGSVWCCIVDVCYVLLNDVLLQ